MCKHSRKVGLGGFNYYVRTEGEGGPSNSERMQTGGEEGIYVNANVQT